MRKVLFLAAVLFAGCVLAALPDSGRAAAPSTVLQDDAVFLHRDPAAIRDALRRAAALGIDRIRLTAGWSVIAPNPDDDQPPAAFDGSDPAAYPDHAWDNLDRAVTLVTEAGLRPMIDIGFWAPRWGTGPQAGAPGRFRTDINPTMFAAFATAVAHRYDGAYLPPSPPAPDGPPSGPSRKLLDALLGRSGATSPVRATPSAPLPRVDLYTLWNEPNHPGFVLPQWREHDGVLIPDSPIRYRAMIAAAYPAVKTVAPDATVLIGGTSSMGSSIPGRSGVPPLRFLRELACVDRRLQPITTGTCANFHPIPSDGWAHHPYSLHTTPDRLPRDADLLPVARTAALRRTLVTLQRNGRFTGNHAADLYLTEYGYETTTPDPEGFVSPADQARLLAWAEWLGTSVPGVMMWPQFLLEDRPGGPAGPRMRAFGDWQTGLWFADGTPKPAAAAFRTPTFALCTRQGTATWTSVWARLRGGLADTTAEVQVQAGSTWQLAQTVAARGGTSPTTAPVAIGADAAVRRWVPGLPTATRVVWHTGAGSVVTGPAVQVEPCPKVTAPKRAVRMRSKHGRSRATKRKRSKTQTQLGATIKRAHGH